MLLIKYIFISPILKTSENLIARSAKFSFSKNLRDLKDVYFFRKFASTFLLLQRTIAKKKIQNKEMYIFFLWGGGLPKWANWFLTRSKETKNLIFSSFLASNKSNKPRGAGLKNVCKQNVCADFRVQ